MCCCCNKICTLLRHPAGLAMLAGRKGIQPLRRRPWCSVSAYIQCTRKVNFCDTPKNCGKISQLEKIKNSSSVCRSCYILSGFFTTGVQLVCLCLCLSVSVHEWIIQYSQSCRWISMTCLEFVGLCTRYNQILRTIYFWRWFDAPSDTTKAHPYRGPHDPKLGNPKFNFKTSKTTTDTLRLCIDGL